MNRESQTLFDIIRLLPMRNEPSISDGEAEALYRLWLQMAPGSTKVANSDNKDIRSLVAKGLVRTSIGGVEITDKGRQVIVEMVTHAPNALDGEAKMPSYRDIRAKVARSKQTFVKKAERERHTYNKAKAKKK